MLRGERIVLPADLGIACVTALHGHLLAQRGRPLTVDASAVNRLGGLGLQVLLSAAETWRKDGHEFAVINPSETFRMSVALAGATLPGAAP